MVSLGCYKLESYEFTKLDHMNLTNEPKLESNGRKKRTNALFWRTKKNKTSSSSLVLFTITSKTKGSWFYKS